MKSNILTYCMLILFLFQNIKTGFEKSPVVGILMLQSEFDKLPAETHYLFAELVKWITQEGLRWFPIYLTDNEEVLRKKILDSNLILFTGGDVEIYDPLFPNDKKLTQYSLFVKYVVEICIEFNRKKIYKPIYGICLGFQSLILSLTDFEVVFSDDFANEKKKQTVELYLEPESLFGQVFTKENVKLIQTEPQIWHSYNHGFTLENAQKSVLFNERMDLLGTSVTVKGIKVVSAVKHKEYPFYGNLFHPEHAQFHHSDLENEEWGIESLKINRKMARLVRKLIGNQKRTISNDSVWSYRRNLRLNFDFEQNTIYSIIETPIHGIDF